MDGSLPNHSGFASIGNDVEFDGEAAIYCRQRISLGSHIYIGPGTKLYGRGGLNIQDHVIIAPEVVILTSMHNYKNAKMVPYDEIELLRPVVIERCVWIGYRTIIMPGVTLGEGSIIGAGAVLTKSCSPGAIMAGNPAKMVGQRDMEHYYQCVKNGQFYLVHKRSQGLEKKEMFNINGVDI